MEIQHFRHKKHPLILKDDKSTIDQSVCCEICGHSKIVAPFYACDSCGYYLHKLCAELPQFLNHTFHPSHPLTLTLITYGNYSCDSCHRVFSNTLSFRCTECNFDMDVECAMMPPITFTEIDQKNIIQHFSHQHPMPLVEIDNKDEIICFGCQSTMCFGDRVYGCTKCKYFLHESCAKSPKNINWPFHSNHPPLRFDINFWGFKCSDCNKSYDKGFIFKCLKCSFRLCMICTATRLSRSIKYEYHEHLLYFFWDKSDPFNECSYYDSYCKRPGISYGREVSHTSSCAFYCLECDFKVHLLCGPLPSMIKYECHVHALILVDSLVEDNSGEYYCDVCETERDPRIRVYYCKQCKYIAHVHCVTSKIIEILRGDLQNVELKSLGEDIWKLAQEKDADALIVEEEEQGTLKDFINGLPEREQRILKIYYKWDIDGSSKVKNNDESAQSKLGDEHINRILQLSRFTIQHFTKFFDDELRSFFRNNKLELKSSDLGLKMVSVEGYKIPHVLAPVLKTLLHKYGDVSSKRTWGTEEWQSIVYFILCKVLKGMCSTNVADITRDLLQEWYYHLTFVEEWGFKIDFAFAHLKRLVRAFLGLEAKRLEKEIPRIIKEKIAKLQEEITEEKSKLKKCEEYCGSSAKSDFMEDCLNKASKLKWKTACEGLLTDDPQATRNDELWW